MENSTINKENEPIVEANVEHELDRKVKSILFRKKVKIIFDIVILLIAFTGVVVNSMDLHTDSVRSILAFSFPMIMYAWVILNRILDIIKQIN